jgi:hypothetical protein
MVDHKVIVFREYPFVAGDKIHIGDGCLRGDWLVLGVDERKIQLRCPVSGREVEWERTFCFTEERRQAEWPEKQGK